MVVAVGGQCRNVGKTSLICSLIEATRDTAWIAVKISRHRHGASIEGARLDEEFDRNTENDTGRFLRAGAARAFWLRAPGDDMTPAAEHVRELEKLSPVIVESNSLRAAIRPDLYVVILDPRFEDFKTSAKNLGPLADAIVAPDGGAPPLREGQPVLRMTSGYNCPDLLARLRDRLPVS